MQLICRGVLFGRQLKIYFAINTKTVLTKHAPLKLANCRKQIDSSVAKNKILANFVDIDIYLRQQWSELTYFTLFV